ICSLLSFFFSAYRDHRDLHSFPTRRSSDLHGIGGPGYRTCGIHVTSQVRCLEVHPPGSNLPGCRSHKLGSRQYQAPCHQEKLARSEEHTSELQSRRDLVCRLLLEKKKKIKK